MFIHWLYWGRIARRFAYRLAGCLLVAALFLMPVRGLAQPSSELNGGEPKAAALATLKVAVLVSMNIRPFIEAAEGVESVLSEQGLSPEIIFFERYADGKADELRQTLVRSGYSALIAVGPDAARFIWSERWPTNPALLYTIILDPEKVESAPAQPCGVSLRIPVEEQLLRIHAGLPEARRIGLIFDPALNRDFFARAAETAERLGIGIVPLRVASPRAIPEVLAGIWEEIDGLWMIPDRTIISESIIKYIIKESLIHRVPVIGYNRFFVEAGAGMSFVFDYRHLGEQTGRLVLRMLAGDLCFEPVPVYEVIMNGPVLNRIDVPFRTPDMPTGGVR